MPDTTNQAPAATPAAPPVDVRAIEDKARDAAIKAEKARTTEIMAIGKRFDVMDLAATAIEAGTGLDAFRAEVMEKKFHAKPIVPPSDGIGLSDKEKRQYSILRAIRSMDPNASREDKEAAGFELECSRAVAKNIGKTPAGIYMPLEVRTATYLNVGTASEGGNLKATDLLAGSFIDMLRNRMRVRSMGATILSGLVGDIAIPRQSGGATAYWLAEDAQTTASKLAVDQVTLAPKTVAGMTEMTRKLLMQSSIDVENLVRQDLATTLALALDRAALHGRGLTTYNEPLGLAGVSGIGSVAGGDNGLAPAWSHIVGLETEVAIDNADVGTLGYLTNSKVRGKLKQTQRIATYGDDMIWQDGPNGEGTMNGYRAAVSNQVSAALTKGTSSGVASAIFFGNWADLLIGLWGGLDITIDPYTYSDRGRVRVVMMQDTDIAVRHPESFAAMLDALTA
ncbi:MAG: phage major capsid protein [Acidobacteriota bacterium]